MNGEGNEIYFFFEVNCSFMILNLPNKNGPVDRSVPAILITAERADNFSGGTNIKQMAQGGNNSRSLQDILY